VDLTRGLKNGGWFLWKICLNSAIASKSSKKPAFPQKMSQKLAKTFLFYLKTYPYLCRLNNFGVLYPFYFTV
jgi:hypothetical protein